MHDSGLEVDPFDLRQGDTNVRIAAKYISERWGDLAFGEDPGRHLIKQRLEEMVVPPVEDRYRDRSRLERSGSKETGEATANDHHVVAMGMRAPIARPSMESSRSHGRRSRRRRADRE